MTNCRFGVQNTRGDFTRGRRLQNRATKKGQRPKDRHLDKGFSKRLVGSLGGLGPALRFCSALAVAFALGVFCLLLVLGLGLACFASCVRFVDYNFSFLRASARQLFSATNFG